MRAGDYVGQGVRVYTKIDYKTGAAFCMSPEDWILPADHVYQFVVNDGPVSSHQSTTGSGGGTDRGGHGCGRGPGRGSGPGRGGGRIIEDADFAKQQAELDTELYNNKSMRDVFCEAKIDYNLLLLREVYTKAGSGILTDYAIVAGSDYSSFKGIGSAKAIQIVCNSFLHTGSLSNLPEIARECQARRTKGAEYSGQDVLFTLQRAWHAFRSPYVFNPLSGDTGACLYVRLPEGSLIDDVPPGLASVVGEPMNIEDTLNHVFCLVKPVTSLSLPNVAPVTSVARPGETIPISLQCWMIPGSRPEISWNVATRDQIESELKRASLSCEGVIHS